MTVVDVGAYHGYFSLIAAKLVGSNGRVFAFEPYPNSICTMKYNIKLNNFSNINLSDYALYSETIDLPLRYRHEASCFDFYC
ncbi:MAG: FkbM family methyltransferase [Nitrospirae bacterium]|nr:FkbM family methyltransferase [Nitrospirota bacterium]